MAEREFLISCNDLVASSGFSWAAHPLLMWPAIFLKVSPNRYNQTREMNRHSLCTFKEERVKGRESVYFKGKACNRLLLADNLINHLAS